MRTVAVSGASGLIGSALTRSLTADGHAVRRLVRGRAAAGEIRWDPATGEIDLAALEGVDAVVHLAGEPAGARWTAAKKRRIRDSRVEGTRLLAGALAKLERPPSVLVSASAIGYYGDRGDERILEDSPPGEGFLPRVAAEWEAALRPAEQIGIRVVRLRTGIVLSREGGALRRLLLPFRLGVGGVLGSGSQWMSWISLDDVVSIIRFALERDDISGPVNAVAPEPVRNSEFTRTLARVLRRPAWIPVPAFALRLLFAGMADEALLASQRVVPARLLAAGFPFRHTQLESAIRAALA